MILQVYEKHQRPETEEKRARAREGRGEGVLNERDEIGKGKV